MLKVRFVHLVSCIMISREADAKTAQEKLLEDTIHPKILCGCGPR